MVYATWNPQGYQSEGTSVNFPHSATHKHGRYPSIALNGNIFYNPWSPDNDLMSQPESTSYQGFSSPSLRYPPQPQVSVFLAGNESMAASQRVPIIASSIQATDPQGPQASDFNNFGSSNIVASGICVSKYSATDLPSLGERLSTEVMVSQ